MPSETDLLWRLAGEVGPCLGGAEKAMVYATVGAGEFLAAAQRILAVAVRDRIALPNGLVTNLSRWLDGYAGSPEEPALRDLLAQAQKR